MKKNIEILKELVQELTEDEKEELRKLLQKTITSVTLGKERVLGKFDGRIIISEDFNEPLPDFEEYTRLNT